MAHDSPADMLTELWAQQRYMEALTTAWQTPPVYNALLLMPRGGPISLRELLVRSCQQALALAAQETDARATAQTWVDTLLSQLPPPPALIDHGDGNEAEAYRERLIRTHLECVRLALSTPRENLSRSEPFVTIAAEVGFPAGFLRDLTGVLLSQHQSYVSSSLIESSVSLTALLVGATRGVTATLTLELLKDGAGAFYPVPAFAFVRRDEEFQQAEEAARVWSGLASQPRDVRWHLRRFDGQPLGTLVGPSLGAAFSLGLARLLSRHEEVADIDLAFIGATAAVDSDGALRKIGALWQKLGEQTTDLARRGLLRCVVVAEEQEDVPEPYVSEYAEPVRVLKVRTVYDALQQLREQGLPRRAVRQYERDQCQWLDAFGLGRGVSFATHYQQLQLLREVRRERVPQGSSHVPHARDHRALHQDTHSDFHTVDVVRWEETLQGEVVTYEPVSVDILFDEPRQSENNAEGAVFPRVVILGPPGSGKSTFLQSVSWRATSGDMFSGKRSLLPISIRLREWEAWVMQQRTAEAGLPMYLAEHYKNLTHPPSVEQWRHWLLRGEVLLLLDGLDEIESTPMFVNALKNALLLFKTSPTVMTCRTVSFPQYKSLCPEFLVLTLGGLQEDQQTTYVQSILTEGIGYDTSAQFLIRLRSLPQLKALAANPLLLGIIAQVVDSAGAATLPTTRGQLYQHAIERLLTRLPRRVEVQYPGQELAGDEKIAVVQRAALDLFARGGHSLTFTSEELGQAIKEALREEGYGASPAQWANSLRTDLIHNSGILRGNGEQGFFFLHLTVQEFLAAGAIAKRVNEVGWETMISLVDTSVSARSLVEHKSWDPRWHEVITLLAGQLKNPAPLLQLLAERKKDDLFGCRLTLAVQCLPEIPLAMAHSQAALVDRITHAACALWFRHRRDGTEAAIPHLTRALPALGQCNGRVENVPLLQWLCQRLQDADSVVRAAAIEALGWMGEQIAQHPDVLSPVTAAVRDADPLVRSEALVAIRRVGKGLARYPALLQSLKQTVASDPDGVLRLGAARALAELGETVDPPPVAAHALVTASTPDGSDRRQTPPEIVLAHEEDRGSLSLQTPAVLIAALYDESRERRSQAANALGQIGSPAAMHPEVLTALVQVGLHDRDGGVRSEALRALERIGTIASQYPHVLRGLGLALQNDRDAGVRAQAARTLGNVENLVAHHGEILPSLMAALHDEDSYVRYRAAEAVKRLIAGGVRIFRRWWGKVEGKLITDL